MLAGVHGSPMINGMFMREGASVVEVRPYGFHGRPGGGWANIYMKVRQWVGGGGGMHTYA